jgi:hypothetical protein
MPASGFISTADRELELLVCIYTCRKHADLLAAFYATEFGQYLKGLQNTLILETYADPEISESMHVNEKLILKTNEKYENLSVKTYLMIDYCVSNFKFRNLLKVDVTTVLPRSNLDSASSHAEITPDQLVRFLGDRGKFGDYEGIKLLSDAGRSGAENWARKKGGAIDYLRVFGNRNMPPYYTGKCYFLSHCFARFISQHGASMAREHAHYLMGSEDVMIGRLYGAFKLTKFNE